MRALSVKEPWASLIMFCGKDTENRIWRTRYRGPLVICASARPDHRDSIGWDSWARLKPEDRDLMNGYAIGIVDLVDCDVRMRSEWDEPGQFHFRLANPRPFVTPFRVKGQLGMFDIDDALVEAALKKAA